jgi:hypothetical protein
MTTTAPISSPAAEPVRDDRTVVANAWPTGRPIYRYTVEELADGVDVYTRSLKARRRDRDQRGERDA